MYFIIIHSNNVNDSFSVNIMLQHLIVFVSLSKIMLTEKKYSKLIEYIMIKYINNYKYHNYFVRYKL